MNLRIFNKNVFYLHFFIIFKFVFPVISFINVVFPFQKKEISRYGFDNQREILKKTRFLVLKN